MLNFACLLLPEDPTLPGGATERRCMSSENQTDRHVKAGSAIQMTLYIHTKGRREFYAVIM
jgi:hypothetical protein